MAITPLTTRMVVLETAILLEQVLGALRASASRRKQAPRPVAVARVGARQLGARRPWSRRVLQGRGGSKGVVVGPVLLTPRPVSPWWHLALLAGWRPGSPETAPPPPLFLHREVFWFIAGLSDRVARYRVALGAVGGQEDEAILSIAHVWLRVLRGYAEDPMRSFWAQLSVAHRRAGYGAIAALVTFLEAAESLALSSREARAQPPAVFVDPTDLAFWTCLSSFFNWLGGRTVFWSFNERVWSVVNACISARTLLGEYAHNRHTSRWLSMGSASRSRFRVSVLRLLRGSFNSFADWSIGQADDAERVALTVGEFEEGAAAFVSAASINTTVVRSALLQPSFDLRLFAWLAAYRQGLVVGYSADARLWFLHRLHPPFAQLLRMESRLVAGTFVRQKVRGLLALYAGIHNQIRIPAAV